MRLKFELVHGNTYSSHDYRFHYTSTNNNIGAYLTLYRIGWWLPSCLAAVSPSIYQVSYQIPRKKQDKECNIPTQYDTFYIDAHLALSFGICSSVLFSCFWSKYQCSVVIIGLFEHHFYYLRFLVVRDLKCRVTISLSVRKRMHLHKCYVNIMIIQKYNRPYA